MHSVPCNLAWELRVTAALPHPEPRPLVGNHGRASGPVTLDMPAPNYDFDSSEAHVKIRRAVELRLVVTDRKHGFVLKPFGMHTALVEGQPSPFVPGEAIGELGFRCGVLCGDGDLGIKGEMIVE